MSDLRRRKPAAAEPDEPTASADDPASGSKRIDPLATSQPKRTGSLVEAGLVFLLFALATIVPVYMLISRRDSSDVTPASILSGRDAYAVCSVQGGKQIYTVDEGNTRVECMAIHKNKIIATGDLTHIRKRWAALSFSSNDLSMQGGLRVHYLNADAVVIPGIADSHTHILEYGASRQLALEGATSVEETVTRIRNYVLGDPELFQNPSAWVFGSSWDQTTWTPQTWPTSDHLENDPILRGRRIVLYSKDYHAIWVSKKVMDAIPHIPDTVEGGAIMRDKAGKPTGVFLDSAQSLVKRPAPSLKELEKRLELTANDALSYGITSMHDAGFKPLTLEFFTQEAAQNTIPLRVYGMSYFNESEPYWGEKRERLINHANGRLTYRSVKIFADGALRSGGAAMYDPYSDNPETHGFMRISTETLRDVVPKFMRDGWQVNIHAIGDRANKIVLDVFEEAIAKSGRDVSELRPRLEHAQIMTPEDAKRLGKLGVIASIQPSHATSDMWYAEDKLGPERIKGLYAFRNIKDSGARFAFGTDLPVEDMNPFLTFYSAVTRLSAEGTSPHGPGGWFPEQRLTREEALRGMTIEPAYAAFRENELGSLVPGKLADFAIISQDVMSIPVDRILQTKVLATVLDGEVVYGTMEKV